MQVLQLVTTPRPFFERQIDVLERKGVQCTTIAVPGRYDPDASDSRSLADYLRFYPRVLRRSLSDWDLIHANYGLTAPIALAQLTRPVILSLWGSDLMGKYGFACRWFARYCDEVIVMTGEMAGDLGMPCHVVPHGIDMTQFAPIPQMEAREAVGWNSETLHVLFPYSTERPVKDYPRAERVVRTVSIRLPKDVSLKPISGVPHDRIATYMNAADALLLTSKREGSPNTVKEAMACNLPVVATDVGDIGEVLSGVTPSAVCRSDEELVEALVNVFTTDRRPNSRAAVREFSLDRMGDRLIEIYHGSTGESN